MTTTDTAPAYEVERAACGTRSHWTVLFEGEQVACRRTKAQALAYVEAATTVRAALAAVCWCGDAATLLQPPMGGDEPTEAVCDAHLSRDGYRRIAEV